MEKFKFDTGGVWEGDAFEIEVNHITDDNCYVPCKHAHSPHKTRHYRSDGTFWEEQSYIVPFVAVQYNEGGFCTTGTCAECIAEALQNLKNA